MAAEGLTLAQILSSNTPQFNEFMLKITRALDAGQLSPAEYAEKFEPITGYKAQANYTRLGKPLGYTFQRVSETSVTNPINSNVSSINRGTLSTPLNTSIDAATGKVKSWRILPPSAAPSTWSYVANSVATPILAVATGIALGKTFDSALYNAFPDFWDANGMSSLNPDTWNSLTRDIDYTDPITGAAASAMNLIFGLNPDEGTVTPYMDEESFAYMAQYLYSKGVFASPSSIDVTNPDGLDIDGINSNFKVNYGNFFYYKSTKTGNNIYGKFQADKPVAMCFQYITGSKRCPYIMASNSPFKWGWSATSSNIEPFSTLSIDAEAYTYDGKTVYYAYVNPAYGFNVDNPLTNITQITEIPSFLTANQLANVAWLMVYQSSTPGGMEGISDQPNAQLPDTTNWETPSSILPSLQQQYPEIFGDPVQWTTANPDGTETTRNYIPIPLPDFFSNTDTQPTSGEQTQTDIKVSPDFSPETLIDSLTKLLQQPEESPFSDTTQPTQNPPDTGEGSTPDVVAPTGSASALWAIYHPTQNQIDQFGAWLWSSDFIDQILKIFNNPMESIIGLHKIYASPVDAGQSTIGVGYLDSGVPSAYITQQYITVDCGEVVLSEQFGSVFDYSPFTEVKLYLPFVGIVSLNVHEVMRSTIAISYGVDVLTGACLASVTVKRDGQNSILYQYAGNCAVQYPISSGSYMGIVSSILGVAGSAIATFASGGSLAPLAIGAATATFGAHTNVQNSGSFSGNAGAMGGKIPYLIISRPQTKIADGQSGFLGTPTNEMRKLGYFNGFVKCDEIHLENIPATDEELSKIQTSLYSGVLI